MTPIRLSRITPYARVAAALAAAVFVAVLAVPSVCLAEGVSWPASADRLPLAGGAVSLATTPSATPTANIDAYRGMGTWIDIYDEAAWANPEAAVRDMKRHRVRTLYIETGNSSQKAAVYKSALQARFIRAAHAQGIRVIAWYLPYMTNTDKDYGRIKAAIRFRTADGQKFDGFALDIESENVRSNTERNKRLVTLTRRTRNLVGATYALGGIIPPPTAMGTHCGYWPLFPYQYVASNYDVILPMGYWTYRHGAARARDYTLANIRKLREQPGCADKPIHEIGGIAQAATSPEVTAFVAATQKTGCVGASMYTYPGVTQGMWAGLQSVAVR